MPSPFKSGESASALKAASNRANGKKGGRPPGSLGPQKIEAREEMRGSAPLVAAELIRLALHAKAEPVRAAACRDILAYAWGRPIAVDFSEGGGNTQQITVINVVTGVRG